MWCNTSNVFVSLAKKKQILNIRNTIVLVVKPTYFCTLWTPNSELPYTYVAVPQQEYRVTANRSLVTKYNPNARHPSLSSVRPRCIYFDWFFVKFKYIGKGLKIKKSNLKRQVVFNLGASHESKWLFDPTKIQIRRTKKNTFALCANTANPIFELKSLSFIRKFNKYTRRGLRLCRQPVIRRFGKVSQIASKRR